MDNNLLEKVLTGVNDDELRNELVKHLFKNAGRKTYGIPMLKDCQRQLNNDEIYGRMKAIAGGTGVSVARILNISPQGLNNQLKRGAISGNSIIDFHLRTGVSADWLIGSWNGSTEDIQECTDTSEVEKYKDAERPLQQYLSLVEIYDQSNGEIELKWCLTKHHDCYDDNNLPVPNDFGAILSLIIRYRDEAGTPDRVRSGKKRHYHVRKVLAYVLGDAKKIRKLDAMAKKLSNKFLSGQIDRPGKTEFRLYSAKADCLSIFGSIAKQQGLLIVEPEFSAIAWDYLIGPGSLSPRDWVLQKLQEFNSKEVR